MASTRARGFTLIEMIVALVLLALIASVLFGSLRLSARSWDAGEMKAEQSSQIRLAHDFLRTQLGGQFPMRQRMIADMPLLFAGDRDTVRFVSALPDRVGGGVYLFRLALSKADEDSRLVLERIVPDPQATTDPEFRDAESSVLAQHISELKIEYFGREGDNDLSTWRDHWDSKQRLPELVRINIASKDGGAWPELVIELRVSMEAGLTPGAARRLGAGRR